jgi:hypothetical protein
MHLLAPSQSASRSAAGSTTRKVAQHGRGLKMVPRYPKHFIVSSTVLIDLWGPSAAFCYSFFYKSVSWRPQPFL